MTEIERYEEPRRATLAEKVQYAEQLAQADMLPDAYRRKPGNVLVAVEYGDMLGVHPLTAVSHINVIKGKPTQSAELMRASVRRAGHKFREITSTDTECEVQIVRADDPEFPFNTRFDMDDARRAELLSNPSWKKFPKAMLQARATSACVRMACPEVLMGISYVPEELGADVDEEGNVLVSVVADEFVAAEARLPGLLERIKARSAGLTAEQRAVLGGWRQDEGISFTNGRATVDGAERTLAKLDEILGADPDDDIVDAELVDDDDDEDSANRPGEAAPETGGGASIDQSTPEPETVPGDAGQAPGIPDNPEFDIDPEPVEAAFEPMTEQQSKKLHALLRSVFEAAGPARFPALSHLLDREITSTKEISKREAIALIDTLESMEPAA